jgi:mitochondrial import inner membrane translocase subunit TIM22
MSEDFETMMGNMSPDEIKYRMESLLQNCGVKAVLSTVAGGAMGMVFGSFFGANIDPSRMSELDKLPMRRQMAAHVKEMGTAGFRMAKQFALIGAMFALSECIVEKARGRSDLGNSAAAGCITGAALAYKSGMGGICLGAAGFAAFSLAIDHFMHEDDPRDLYLPYSPYVDHQRLRDDIDELVVDDQLVNDDDELVNDDEFAVDRFVEEFDVSRVELGHVEDAFNHRS